MLAQNALALKGGQAARGAESFDGGGDGGFGVLAASLHDAGDQAAVVGGADLDDVAIFLPPAIHKKTVRRNRRDRHLCHGFRPPSPRLASIIGLLDDKGRDQFSKIWPQRTQGSQRKSPLPLQLPPRPMS